MQITNDPIRDAERYFDAQQERTERRPECDVCGEHIQTEYLYTINGMVICEDCMADYRHYTEDWEG